jgi:hypothetical protein
MNSRSRFVHQCVVLATTLGLAASIAPVNAQDDDAEARRLYAVATTALGNNDFEVAARNFERAANLAPNNAAIRLNLAMVQNKLERIKEAGENLKRALAIGLEGDKNRSLAEDLQAELDYKAEKIRDEARKKADYQRVNGPLEPFVGEWAYRGPSRTGTENPSCFVMANSAVQSIALPQDKLQGGILEGHGDVHSQYKLSCNFCNYGTCVPSNPDFRWTREVTWKLRVANNSAINLEITGECTSGPCPQSNYPLTCQLKVQGNEMIRSCPTDTDGPAAFQRISGGYVAPSSPEGNSSPSTKTGTITYTPGAGSSSTPVPASNQPDVKIENGVTTYTPRSIPAAPVKKDPF